MVADAAPEGGVAVLLDAGVETTPYVSKEGRFTVAAPTGVTPNATTAGVGWGVRGATLVVSYYDGKPRGVDRTRLYDLARDKIGGSEIEREDDVKVGGFPTRMRRMRLVIPGKPVQWRRSAIVVAGDRTYDISCTSPGQADMSAPLTDKFFESFHIDAAK